MNGNTQTGHIHRIGPPKALFRGVWDLALLPSKGKNELEETPGDLRGRLRTHTGHAASQFVAVHVLGPGKAQKTAQNIASFNDHTHIDCSL